MVRRTVINRVIRAGEKYADVKEERDLIKQV